MMNDPERARKIREERAANALQLAMVNKDTTSDIASAELESRQKIAAMQFGPGGQMDRNNIAMAPVHSATANQANAAADLNKFGLGVAQETRPNLIAQNKSTMDLNAATNISEVTPLADKNYTAWKASNMAKPEWANTPYQPTVHPVTRGWAQKLWEGDLYNPFSDKNKEEDEYAARVRKANESYLAHQ